MLSRSQPYGAGQPGDGKSPEVLRIEEITVLIAVSAFCALAMGIYIATFVMVLRG